MTASRAHIPALLTETIEAMSPSPGDTIVDGTLGLGGHAEALLAKVGAEGRVIGIDRDPHALALAAERLERFGKAFVPVRGNHTDLVHLLRELGVEQVNGILFDLGVSSLQLDDAERGFSFRNDGPLDMRMDPDSGQSAAEFVATASEEEIRRVLWRYGEERRAAAIAKEIVRRRESERFETTRQLADLIRDVLGPIAQRYKIHPATRTFQAVRIAVNREIDDLERLITDSTSLLATGGRLAIISYHSLEDRAAKQTLRSLAQRCVCPPDLPVCGCGREDLIRLVTTKAIRPTSDEIARNPRARSARLRVGERL